MRLPQVPLSATEATEGAATALGTGPPASYPAWRPDMSPGTVSAASLGSKRPSPPAVAAAPQSLSDNEKRNCFTSERTTIIRLPDHPKTKLDDSSNFRSTGVCLKFAVETAS